MLSTNFNTRKLHWDQLISLADNLSSLGSNSWLVGGDFNKVLRASEKFGGNHISIHKSSLFFSGIVFITAT